MFNNILIFIIFYINNNGNYDGFINVGCIVIIVLLNVVEVCPILLERVPIRSRSLNMFQISPYIIDA